MALIDNLISYWKLDEASGNALDAHGANALTETSGTIASAAGKIGNARDFEATGDTEYFEIADNADLSTGDVDFAFQCWINAESVGANRRIAGKWGSAGNLEWLLLVTSSDLVRFQVSNDGTASVSVEASTHGAIVAATWYHVACWHDSVNNQIGVAVNAGTPNTTAHSTGVFDSATAFTLGAANATQHWDGLLDEAAFWKGRILTSQERTDLYNGGAGLAYPLVPGAATKARAPYRAPHRVWTRPTRW
jgi:hypothetical protein